MFTRRFSGICFLVALLSAAHAVAADSRPAIGVGATRAQLIDAYGPPTGRSAIGEVEILHYPNGQVRLTNGRVERLSLKTVVALVPVPAPPAKVALPAPESLGSASSSKAPLADVWMTSFEAATRDAARRNSVILALFTTSDATPASRQFHKEIVHHPEFVNAFRTHYVLFHVDFPVGVELPAAVLAESTALRDRYGVTRYPALLILSAAGEKIAQVEISDAVPGNAFRARLISTISGAHELPVPVEPELVPEPPKPPEPAPSQIVVAPTEVTSSLFTARWLITSALIIGTLIAGVMLFALWLVLRKMSKPVALTRNTSMASRIDQAASGLPSFAEIRTWEKVSLCRVVTRLAETDGYVADEQPAGSDKDLVLKRPYNPKPEIIVCCVTGNAGVIPTRRIREMVGMLAADDVPAGWFISPMGFTVDARAYAEQNNIRLIDAAGLLNRLSDLPTFALPKVLASVR